LNFSFSLSPFYLSIIFLFDFLSKNQFSLLVLSCLGKGLETFI
jgi:hypothetical protein